MPEPPALLRRSAAEGLAAFALVFAGCGAVVTNATHTGSRLRLYDLAGGKFVDRFGGFEGDAQEVAFAPDGRSLVTVDWGFDICRHIFEACGLFTQLIQIDDPGRGIRAEYIDVLVTFKPAAPTPHTGEGSPFAVAFVPFRETLASLNATVQFDRSKFPQIDLPTLHLVLKGIPDLADGLGERRLGDRDAAPDGVE